MDNRPASRIWLMRAAYALAALAVIFFQLLPLSTLPPFWAGPDLLMALTFAWAMRQPAFVPALAVASVMLLADFMLQRPPGLYAALVVIGAEQLKRRAGGMRDASFVGEWVAVGMVVITLTLLNRIVLAILVVEQAPMGLTLIQTLMTVAVYPVVVLFSALLFGITNRAPGAEDQAGSRS